MCCHDWRDFAVSIEWDAIDEQEIQIRHSHLWRPLLVATRELLLMNLGQSRCSEHKGMAADVFRIFINEAIHHEAGVTLASFFKAGQVPLTFILIVERA